MVITEAKYTVGINGNNVGVHCKIDNIESNVPMDENNSDYAEILKQVADGDLTIADAD